MYLEFDAISKGFPGVQALLNVTFGADEGSVHALCGENGAGKSTLLKVLSGVYIPDSGQIRINGQPVSFNTPIEAIHAGVAVIYQELHLVPEMSVAENIYLGHLPAGGGIVSRSQLRQDSIEILKQVGVEIDPDAKVGNLSLAQRQMVEIGKALSRNAKVIAFDEPTSSLSTREVEKLFEIIAELKRQGKVIFYVSHRMDEIFRICDACTVLRDGQHVETFTTMSEINSQIVVQKMVGRAIEDIWGYEPRPHGEPALTVENLTGPGLRAPANIEVKRGEIVGLFGLVGAGRTELLKAIYHASKGCHGTIRVQGEVANINGPQSSIQSGVMLCPEDRKKEGIIGLRSVMENTNLSARRTFSKFGFLINDAKEVANATEQVNQLRVKTPSLQQPIGLLSGGNQQKVILGRWLSENVKVLMLDEPTRGIDVGAKREIYEIIYGLAKQGVGVLMVSSELPEVLGVSDRILVMRQGRIVADLSRAEATEETVLNLALPIAEEPAA